MSFRIFVSDEPNTFHYITAVTNKRTNLFLRDQFCQILVDMIKEIKEIHPFKLIAYVIMPDHFHMILNPLEPEISTILRKVKGKTARRIIDALKASRRLLTLKRLESRAKGQDFAVWQTKSSDIDLVSHRFIRQKINYIHLNPVRAGLCGNPKDWKWSSYRAYLPHRKGDVPLEVDLRPFWTEEEIEESRKEES